MKNIKLSLGALALVTLTVLASCQPVTEKAGVILSLEGSNGATDYTANELFARYSGNATGVARYYEAAIELVIRNEMKLESNASVLAEIMIKAENRVEGVKESARSAAETNRTSYDNELESKLDSFNVEDLEELKDYFAYQLMKEEVEDQFYKNNKRELLVGADDYVGYLDTRLPYHVKHILVNVSASSNSFYNGEIAEADAKKLNSVINRLAVQQRGETFGDIAEESSDDPVSASNFGDLGIMSLATSFVNEFKLGVYSYESMFNTLTDNEASKLNIPEYAYDLIQDELGLGEMPFGAFTLLDTVANVTRDSQGNQVNNGSALYFPRNIYFNRYINLRNISVIIPEDIDGNVISTTGLPGFRAVPELNNKVVLTDEVGRPILAVRGGSGSGGGGYQGMHFIVVERSPLLETVEGVSLENYYTTEIPGTTAFPKNNGVELKTFVNFKQTSTRIYKERSETLNGEIKTFDKLLNGRILEKLLASQDVSFNDEALQEAVEYYIYVTRRNNTFNDDLSYQQSWENYTNTLEYQEYERGRLISDLCAEEFSNASTSVEFDLEGACYVK